MADVNVPRGYTLNLAGSPDQVIADEALATKVAIRPSDLGDIKLRVLVREGDAVQIGTPILEWKQHQDVKVTATAAGTVREIRRGERRVLEQITIDVDPKGASVDFGTLAPASAAREVVLDRLCRAGLFARFRQHPYHCLPNPEDTPKGIFVSAFSSSPLGPDLNLVIRDHADALQVGISALARLTTGKVHVSRPAQGSTSQEIQSLKDCVVHTVAGKHPSGNPAIQAFYIDRVRPGETVWMMSIQDVIAVGRLCLTGKLATDRVVALVGNGVEPGKRKHYRIREGMLASDLIAGKVQAGELRIITGDVLSGQQISPNEPIGQLDDMLTIVPEGRKRHFIGWLLPGLDKYSYSRAFASALTSSNTEWSVDTNLHGGHRACIQCGYCNDVCPTDVLCLPTWRAVSYGDLEEAEQFGIKDCVGCGLCTYVCPSKIEIDQIIHDGLTKIQKEG